MSQQPPVDNTPPTTASSDGDIFEAEWNLRASQGDLKGMATLLYEILHLCSEEYLEDEENQDVVSTLHAFIAANEDPDQEWELINDGDYNEDEEEEEDPLEKDDSPHPVWRMEQQVFLDRLGVSLAMADLFRELQLPVPDNTICILWDREKWRPGACSSKKRTREEELLHFRKEQEREPMTLSPSGWDSLWQPVKFLAAAIAEAKPGCDEALELVGRAIEFMELHRERFLQLGPRDHQRLGRFVKHLFDRKGRMTPSGMDLS